METLEFIIYADGRVKEMVTGIVGQSCEAVTAEIEAQLGEVIQHESTAEYYQQPSHQDNEAISRSYSSWA